jgi:hypothetical protein
LSELTLCHLSGHPKPPNLFEGVVSSSEGKISPAGVV